VSNDYIEQFLAPNKITNMAQKLLFKLRIIFQIYVMNNTSEYRLDVYQYSFTAFYRLCLMSFNSQSVERPSKKIHYLLCLIHNA